MKRLQAILTMKRPHGGAMITKMIDSLFPSNVTTLRTSDGEPLAVCITTCGASRTMFSCHLDTVHHTDGIQSVILDEGVGLITTAAEATECLGADDGAGIWLMLGMIDAEIPGTYLFHYGEECGGIGSSGIVQYFPDFLSKFDRAVAFDRRGTEDVITHQSGGRCCSDGFAKALSDSLNMLPGMSLSPSDEGVFTDTANYISIVPECTNISCGYWSAHRPAEYLDYEYLFRLATAVQMVDWEALPTHRDPTTITHDWGNSWGNNYSEVGDLACLSFKELDAWVKRNPDIVTEVLYEALGMVGLTQEEEEPTGPGYLLYDVDPEEAYK